MMLSTKTGIKTNTTLRILHNTPANNENKNIMCTTFECPEPGSTNCSLNPVHRIQIDDIPSEDLTY